MNNSLNMTFHSTINNGKPGKQISNIPIFFKLAVYAALIFIISSTGTLAGQNELRWAADAEGNAPYIFQDPTIPTNVIGFEVDIAKAIADYLGMKPVFVQNQWDGLIPGLNRDDYDIAINGLEITEDRRREVNFSNAYYLTYEQIVIPRGENAINNFQDLKGKKVGALKNSLAERILVDAKDIIVLSYEGEVNAFTDMANGRLEACLVDAPIALYYASWNPQFKLVGPPVGEVAYGIVIRKSDTVLTSRINEAVTAISRSGKLREILDKWNLWNYMMSVYLNDKEPSKVPPSEYKRFIDAQATDLSFSERINRYIGFLPLLGEAAITTVELSILSMLLAIVLGLFLALTRVYAPKPISKLAVFYIEVVRGTPLLIQLYFIFYAAPTIGITFAPFLAGVIGLGLNYAAYEAENYRAGLFSVPRGQMEAAVSLGMSRRQSLRHIIIPQAIRLVIPPMTNDFISLLKDSSLVSVITMVELTKKYYQLATTYYDFIGTGILVAIIYLLLGLPFVKLSKVAEKKFTIDKRRI